MTAVAQYGGVGLLQGGELAIESLYRVARGLLDGGERVDRRLNSVDGGIDALRLGL